MWSPTADPRECWPSRDASTSSWVVTRRERYEATIIGIFLLEFNVRHKSLSITVPQHSVNSDKGIKHKLQENDRS